MASQGLVLYGTEFAIYRLLRLTICRRKRVKIAEIS